MIKAGTAKIFEKLHKLQQENNGLIELNHIDEIIKQFLEILSSNLTNKHEREIYSQIDLISAQIIALKRDVSNVSEETLHDQFIPEIVSELHYVIEQSEKSVTGILDAVDEITAMSQGVEDRHIREELLIRVTKILELCSFQDLMGQKIQRIINHLLETESIIYKMLHTLKPEPNLRCANINEKSLINGPRNEQEAPSQAQIDDLFSNG